MISFKFVGPITPGYFSLCLKSRYHFIYYSSLVNRDGGSNLYILNESNLVKPIRNRMIRDKYNGSYKAIYTKYGIGVKLGLEILLIKDDLVVYKYLYLIK